MGCFILHVAWKFRFILFHFILVFWVLTFLPRPSAPFISVDCRRKRAARLGCSCWRRINLDDRFDFIFTPFDVYFGSWILCGPVWRCQAIWRRVAQNLAQYNL
jgi:hypothetical protein